MSIWNPFKKSDPVQELLDQLQQAGMGPQQPDPNQLGGMQVGWPYPGGGLQIGPQQVQQGGCTIPAIQTHITTILQGLSGMTKEEIEELKNLQQEHAAKVKAAKLNEFKKLPTEMRQFIVNMLFWKQSVDEMNKVHVDKPDRQKELELKDSFSTSSRLHTQAGTSMHSPWGAPMYGEIRLPDGVTAEDLKMAHIEATMEEEVLDG